MIRRSPSRNQRSKSIKTKHVLQIILLLGVCFWLIYQVKHSHDKKKEFDENDAKVSVGTKTAYQPPKLGRKDLHPDKDEVDQNEKNEEEAEDDNIVEDDENLHEHDEQEEGNGHEIEEKKGSKHGVRRGGGGGEREEDESGGGDDEIDESDPENSEVDTDPNEESMDEEKEKEKEKEGDEENEESSGENHSTHEAREEHYKGDDASSAVTHDTHTTSTENETVGLENIDVNSEMLVTKSENRPNYTEESNRNQTGSDFKVTKVELTGETSSNATSGIETGNNSLSNPVDSSYLNNTITAYSHSHSEASSNLTVVIPGASNNITETGANTSSEQNKMVIFSESDQAQNGTVNTTVIGEVKNVQAEELEQGGNRVSGENLRDSNSSLPVKTENGDAAAGESSNLEDGELEKTTAFVASKESENKVNIETSETNKTQNNSHMKEDGDATEDVKFKGATQTGETDETSDSSSGNGTSSDAVEHHATDSSDSHILKDVTEVRTDLDTLPDIRNEGHIGDQTATE